MSSVAFIGLGNMGLPMARNLLQAGYDVRGFDTSVEAREHASAAGITVADTGAEAVQDAGIVITMVPNGPILLKLLEELNPVMGPDALCIDCSTTEVHEARQAHDLMGSRFLDAPVSGGIAGAADGTLTFIVGGDAATLDRTTPLFEAMGNKIVHCGGPGSGQAAKICNNMLLAISTIATCEAVAMGDKLGLDPQALFDVLSTSTGSCWAVNSYYPVADIGPASPADKGFTPGFPAKMMVKDLTLTQNTAALAEQVTPLGAKALDLYRDFVSQGGSETDFSGIITYLSSLKGEQA